MNTGISKLHKILFIIAQAGQAAFLRPLFDKWVMQYPDDINHKIWASDDAKKLLDLSDESLYSSWDDGGILQEYAPDIIISSTCGDNQEIQASEYARDHGIKHIQFIDSFYDYQRRVKASNPNGYSPNAIWVIHDIAKTEAIERGLDPKIIKTIGHPFFEMKSLNPVSVDASNNDIVFASQHVNQIDGLKEELGFDQFDIWNHLRDLRAQYSDDIGQLIYAAHPAEKQFPELRVGERFLEKGEDIASSAKTMIGMFSAVMIESYLRGQNVVSVQSNLKCENKDILSRKGLIPLVTSGQPKDIKTALDCSSANQNTDFSKSFIGSLDKVERSILNLCG